MSDEDLSNVIDASLQVLNSTYKTYLEDDLNDTTPAEIIAKAITLDIVSLLVRKNPRSE